jgi:hypothetical protein
MRLVESFALLLKPLCAIFSEGRFYKEVTYILYIYFSNFGGTIHIYSEYSQ